MLESYEAIRKLRSRVSCTSWNPVLIAWGAWLDIAGGVPLNVGISNDGLSLLVCYYSPNSRLVKFGDGRCREVYRVTVVSSQVTTIDKRSEAKYFFHSVHNHGVVRVVD